MRLRMAALIAGTIVSMTSATTAAAAVSPEQMPAGSGGPWDHSGPLALVADSGSRYHPIAPTRLFDSRIGLGGATPLRAGIPEALPVTGKAGIPAGAVAVSGNLTVTAVTSSGHVSLTPVEMAVATVTTSTLNVVAGDTRANGFTSSLGSDGRLWAVFATGQASGRVDVILDISGWYGTDASGGTYHPLGPARLVDSRIGLGAVVLRSRVPQALPVGGVFGIPADALAVTGNVTVTGATRGGYIAVVPSSTATPPTSTINFSGGQTIANGVTATLGQGSRLWVVYVSSATTDTAQVIFDATGYFAADASGALFHALAPFRALDTRRALGFAGSLVQGAPRAVSIASQAGVPAGAFAAVGNLTVTGPTASGYLTLGPVRATPSQVATSTLNFRAADTRANGLSIQLGQDGRLWVVLVSGLTTAATQVIFDVDGYFSRPSPAPMSPMPAYFRGGVPNDAAPKDAAGVVMVDYGGTLGLQYNPVTVAQAAICYYNRWRFSGESASAQAADQAAFMTQVGWLVREQTADGLWLYRFPWGTQPVPWWSAIAEGFGISAVLRAYSVTGDTRYLEAAARARSTFERATTQSGVIRSVPVSGRAYALYEEYLPGYSQHVLNGWLFGLVGLYEDAVYAGDPMAWFDILAADRGVRAVAAFLPYYDSGSWSYYDLTRLGSSPPGSLAPLAYHDIHIGQLQFLGANLRSPVLLAYSQRFAGYLATCTAAHACPAQAPAQGSPDAAVLSIEGPGN